MPLERSKRGPKALFIKLGALFYDFVGYVAYKITTFISIIVLKLFFRLEVRSRQYVPTKGPIILAANHFSLIDPWVLQVACPRRITYMVESIYYESWGWWFYRMHKAIPVKERGLNKEALVTGLNVLKKNGVLGIFPEGWGKVDGKVGQGHPGVAMLSHKSHVPVLPVYIAGAYGVLPKGAILPRFTRLTITYGRPIRFNNIEKPDKETLRRMTDEIMERIRELSRR
ncbi:MAG: lysophospholipid acyltransferase family protein [Candidatus Brocadiales bacterium]